MKSDRVQMLPIAKIRIVNPRSRDKIKFAIITASIGRVGLKRPVLVTEREPDADGTLYDLVCGQGRIEALSSLGHVTVPAIIIDVSTEDRYLMSLIENIARPQPATTALVHEVQRLKAAGYNGKTIAQKLGLEPSYITGILHLLRKGEDRLIARVEKGTIPLKVAITIATASSQDIQRALSEAYEEGSLRGAKLQAAQRLVAQRANIAPSDTQLTGKDLVRMYEKHTERQRGLIRRAGIVSQRLALLTSLMQQLLADDHFATLLRAEGFARMPQLLADRVR